MTQRAASYNVSSVIVFVVLLACSSTTPAMAADFPNMWIHELNTPIAAPSEFIERYGPIKSQSAIYSGTIDSIERAIARLLVHVREADAPEDTLIVYSSDNGSDPSDRVGRLRATEGSSYEDGIRASGIFPSSGQITNAHGKEEF